MSTTPTYSPPDELSDVASNDSDSTTLEQPHDNEPERVSESSDAEAVPGPAVCYDKVDDVWRCADCLWEVADGCCAGCGNEYEGPAEMLDYDQQARRRNSLPHMLENSLRAHCKRTARRRCASDDSLAFDRPSELKSPPASPWLSATDYAEAFAVSPINHNKNPSVLQKLRAAGATASTIDEFDMYWHELDGAVAKLSSDQIEFYAPDGFATVKHDQSGSILSGDALEPQNAPQEWHIALGAVIDFDDDNAADTIARQLDIMLDIAQESDFYLPLPGLTPVGKRTDLWPITVLQESPSSPAYAYSRVIRGGEAVLSINNELWLELNSGKMLRIIKPHEAFSNPADAVEQDVEEEAKLVVERERDGSAVPQEEQDEPVNAASDDEMTQAALTPEPSESSEEGDDDDEQIKVESDDSYASSEN